MTGAPAAARDDRLEKARALLRRSRIEADVSAAGTDGEIAAVHAPPDQLAALGRLAPELRSLGFRYVALELTGAEPNQGTK